MHKAARKDRQRDHWSTVGDELASRPTMAERGLSVVLSSTIEREQARAGKGSKEGFKGFI